MIFLGVDRERKCKCGYAFRLSKFQLVRLLFGDILWRCPECDTVYKYRMTKFAYPVYDKEVKLLNREIVDGKRSVFKRC